MYTVGLIILEYVSLSMLNLTRKMNYSRRKQNKQRIILERNVIKLWRFVASWASPSKLRLFDEGRFWQIVEEVFYGYIFWIQSIFYFVVTLCNAYKGKIRPWNWSKKCLFKHLILFKICTALKGLFSFLKSSVHFTSVWKDSRVKDNNCFCSIIVH